MRWRAKRENQEIRRQQAQCQQNHRTAMNHMLAMEMHKVKGTTHNVALKRRPRTETNASCRGTRLNDLYVGKRHLAIPSLSQVHNFRDLKMQENDRHKYKRANK